MQSKSKHGVALDEQNGMVEAISALYPEATALPGFDIYGDGGDGAKAKVSAW